MKVDFLLKFRYIFIVGVFFLLVNSVFILIAGVVESVKGYIAFIKFGFQSTETVRPAAHLLEGLDYIVFAMVFMIFGLGLGQLFLFGEWQAKHLPAGLKVNSIKELKVILWETIVVALVIFCVTHLLRNDLNEWDILPFPILILILSIALFFMKAKGFRFRKGENTKHIDK